MDSLQQKTYAKSDVKIKERKGFQLLSRHHVISEVLTCAYLIYVLLSGAVDPQLPRKICVFYCWAVKHLKRY